MIYITKSHKSFAVLNIYLFKQAFLWQCHVNQLQ
uniref:Uncharacterized protein n=1 Tax=Rhizophora mucronata TaxID=61149 RepID=A0A2P2N1U8_RHIMU